MVAATARLGPKGNRSGHRTREVGLAADVGLKVPPTVLPALRQIPAQPCSAASFARMKSPCGT